MVMFPCRLCRHHGSSRLSGSSGRCFRMALSTLGFSRHRCGCSYVLRRRFLGCWEESSYTSAIFRPIAESGSARGAFACRQPFLFDMHTFISLFVILNVGPPCRICSHELQAGNRPISESRVAQAPEGSLGGETALTSRFGGRARRFRLWWVHDASVLDSTAQSCAASYKW